MRHVEDARRKVEPFVVLLDGSHLFSLRQHRAGAANEGKGRMTDW